MSDLSLAVKSPRDRAIHTYTGYDTVAEVGGVRAFRGMSFEQFTAAAEVSECRVTVKAPEWFIFDAWKTGGDPHTVLAQAYQYLMCIVDHDGQINLHGVFHKARGIKVWSKGKRSHVTFYLTKSETLGGWFVAIDALIDGPDAHGSGGLPHLSHDLKPDALTYEAAFTQAIEKVIAFEERITPKIIKEIEAKLTSWAPSRALNGKAAGAGSRNVAAA